MRGSWSAEEQGALTSPTAWLYLFPFCAAVHLVTYPLSSVAKSSGRVALIPFSTCARRGQRVSEHLIRFLSDTDSATSSC